MDVPLRLTKYENSAYSYPLARTFRESVNPPCLGNLYPQTVDEFMDFVMKNHASPVIVLFGHGKDPVMTEALSIVSDFDVKIVVVNVGVVSALGAMYDIRRCTLMKIYKARVINIYTDEFRRLPMQRFFLATSTWRSTDMMG